MRKALIAAIITIASLAASPAMASSDLGQSGQSATVNLSGTVSRFCTMGTTSAQILLNTQQSDYYAPIEFTCNFTGTPTVTAASANGGLINSATSAVTNYRLAVADALVLGGGAGYVDASSLVSGGQDISTTGNGAQPITILSPGLLSTAAVAVYLNNFLYAAGTYSDTLTITIAP